MLNCWVRFHGPLLGKHGETIIRVIYFKPLWIYFLFSPTRVFPPCAVSGMLLCKYSQQKTLSCISCCLLCQCWSDPQQIFICIRLSSADAEFICCKASSEAALCLRNMKEREEQHRAACWWERCLQLPGTGATCYNCQLRMQRETEAVN